MNLLRGKKGLNVRPSALIPAPFPRFLSQLVGVSKAGVDEVVSFAICGIYDKPGSEMPIGQPCSAVKAYSEYMEWKNGEGRWPLLAASFYSDLKHAAISKPVTFRNQPSSNPGGNLTDGKLGAEDIRDKSWLGFSKNDMIATVDMGSQQPVNSLATRFLTYKLKGIFLPTSVEFSVSDDGKNFRTLKTVTMDQYLNDRYDCWIDIAMADKLEENARYIRIYAINGIGQWIYADEILVNPEFALSK